ncbi:MAG: inositol monophosphatase [Planctomycetes bacterium]|nr:inositol monophosphatase [Planctomycetota bacterium]
MTRDLEIALAAAEAGAAELRARFVGSGPRIASKTKSTRRDLVTEADKASEAAVLSILRRAFPGDAIVAEETAAAAATGRRTWIVDPLDGTVNFAHGIPIHSVSVGLVVDGEPVVGVVIAPAMGETYAAEVGAGATLNGAAIHASDTADLADAILATGFAYDIENLADQNFDNLRAVATAARGVRRLGSAALDLAWVAAGRLDGFWELHLSPWDVAGGAAVIRAAGGLVTDMTGGPDWLFGRHVAATNGPLHPALLARLARPSFVRP